MRNARKDDTRTLILDAGAALIHRQGYSGTGLQEILAACEVPKGSFYHYFKSKEAFVLALAERYLEAMPERTAALLADASLPPRERLGRFCDALIARASAPDDRFFACGCPVGNLVQELATSMPDLRQRLDELMGRIEGQIAALLREAAERGELAPGLDPDEAARFANACWQGSILRMKAAGSPQPLTVARDHLLRLLFRPAG